MPKLKIARNPGEGDKPKSGLTYDQINLWSDFAEKNNGKSFEEVWAGFSKAYPKSGVQKETLFNEIMTLRNHVAEHAKRSNMKVPDVNTGLAFPKVSFDGKDLGRVNGLMQTQITPIKIPASRVNKTVPNDVTDIWFDQQSGVAAYNNPQTGDIEYAEKSNIYLPRFRGKNPIQ